MIIDYIFIGAMIVTFVIGFFKGFISQIFKLISLVVCVFGTLAFMKPAGQFIFDKGWVPVEGGEAATETAIQAAKNNANMLGFIAVLAICLLVCFILKLLVTKLFAKGKLGIVNRVLGGVLSAGVVFCLVGALYSVVGAAVDWVNAIGNGASETVNGVLAAIGELFKTDMAESATYENIESFMSTDLLNGLFGKFNPLGDFIVEQLGGAAPEVAEEAESLVFAISSYLA